MGTEQDIRLLKSKLEYYINDVKNLREEFKNIKSELQASKNAMESMSDAVSQMLAVLLSNSE